MNAAGDQMNVRLPASTPMVCLSPLVQGNDVIAIGGVQFEDGRRRLVVGQHVHKDTVAKLETALAHIEYEDGRIRWVNREERNHG